MIKTKNKKGKIRLFKNEKTDSEEKDEAIINLNWGGGVRHVPGCLQIHLLSWTSAISAFQ